MYAPLTQYRHVTPVLILLSAALVAVLALLGQATPKALWSAWVTAGVLSAGIWHIVARFRLDGGASVKAFAISWPLLTASLCFARCYLVIPGTDDEGVWGIVQQLALLAFLSLQMSLWQRRVAIIKHMLLGLIIGLTSTLCPHALGWIVLLLIASYYMRCSSLRNMMSALTGIVLGIWVVYLAHFIFIGIDAADGMMAAYLRLFQAPPLAELTAMGTWCTAFVAYVGLLLLVYAMAGLAIDVGQTVRAEASIVLVSVLSLVMMGLLVLDAAHLATLLPMLATLLALQLTIQQANLRSALVEWWILLIIAVGAALCLLPHFIAA